MTDTQSGLAPELSFSKYVRTVQRHPMLSQEEELDLAHRWRSAKDEAAADRLVTAHIRLVVRIASSFRGYGVPANDLVSVGSIGLMQAVRGYDPDRGFRFATYAMWWIRAAMQEHVLHTHSLVKLGTTAAQKRLFFNLRRLKAEMSAAEGEQFPPEQAGQIAKTLNVSEREVFEMDQRLAGGDVSLNAPLTADGAREWQDLLPDEGANQEATLAEREQYQSRIALLPDALKVLNQRQLHILRERRLKDRPATLDELAQQYGVSRERVRQIEMTALAKLRKSMQAQMAQRARQIRAGTG